MSDIYYSSNGHFYRIQNSYDMRIVIISLNKSFIIELLNWHIIRNTNIVIAQLQKKFTYYTHYL